MIQYILKDVRTGLGWEGRVVNLAQTQLEREVVMSWLIEASRL